MRASAASPAHTRAVKFLVNACVRRMEYAADALCVLRVVIAASR